MTYLLENQSNGLCGLANLYGGACPLAVNVWLGCPSQYIVFTRVSSVGSVVYYKIGNTGGSTVLQDNGGSLAQVTYSGLPSQQWSFTETGGGWLVISNQQTGYVLNSNPPAGGPAYATTAPLNSGASSQTWWVDPVYANQQQCIAVAPAYDVGASKNIVVCANTDLGATISGTLLGPLSQTSNGIAISFTRQPPPSGYSTLWGQYYYTNDNKNIATSAGAYMVAVPGFPSASFSVSNDAYRQIPSATAHLSGASIGLSEIMNGFFRGQHRYEDQTSMPEYVCVNGGGLQAIAGTGGANIAGGWKDSTSIDVEMGQEAIALRNLSFAALDTRNFKDAAALRSEVTYGANFFLSGIQNSDGSFPLKIQPAADAPVTSKPKLVMNDNVGSTAKCVAGLAAASLALKQSNPVFADQCLTAAKLGFAWVKAHPNLYVDSNVWGYSDWVGSADSILDAAVELAIATHDPACIADAKNFFNDGKFDPASGAWVKQSGSYTYQRCGLHAATALARWSQDSSLDGYTRGNVFQQLRVYYVAVSGMIDTPFGTKSGIMNQGFGLNPQYQQEGLTYANLYRAIGLSSMLVKARDQYNWLAGVNPFNTSFIIGAGYTNIWPAYNRPRLDSIGELVCGAWLGASMSDPLIGSIGRDNTNYVPGSDYGFTEGGVGDTSFLPANLTLMDKIVNTPISNTPINNRTYQIISLNSGHVLDVTNNSTNDGASIDQWYPNGGDNQKWTLVHLTNGYWKIVSVNSQKCLEVPSSSTSLSTVLDQATYTGSTFQQWSITPYGDGSYELQNRGSGLAADVQGGSVAPGALVNQYNYWAGDNQRWILNASPAPVDLSGSYNCNGIGNDGTPTSSGGLDGGNYIISGNQLGSQQIWNGATFKIGDIGNNNVVTAKGQTITLPKGNYSSLLVLADAVNGSATGQTITVQYVSGLPSTFTQSFSDWAIPQGYSGETNVISTYRNNPAGGSDINIQVYGYTFVLDNKRSVASLTLPNNQNLKIIAATLAP